MEGSSERAYAERDGDSELAEFFKRAQGRLQGHTPSFAQHLRGTEEPSSLLEFSFGSSVAGQPFQEDWGAQRSSQFFGEREALFVQGLCPIKVTAQESHPSQIVEW